MTPQSTEVLPDLYEADETAWLDSMAELIQQGRFNELDYLHLGEYLADMARRDRREVKSRLKVLIVHLLKWTHQSNKRSRSWRGTIVDQRQELEDAIGRGVLRNYATEVLPEAYRRGVERASEETGLPATTFPAQCPYTLDQLLSASVLED